MAEILLHQTRAWGQETMTRLESERNVRYTAPP